MLIASHNIYFTNVYFSGIERETLKIQLVKRRHGKSYVHVCSLKTTTSELPATNFALLRISLICFSQSQIHGYHKALLAHNTSTKPTRHGCWLDFRGACALLPQFAPHGSSCFRLFQWSGCGFGSKDVNMVGIVASITKSSLLSVACKLLLTVSRFWSSCLIFFFFGFVPFTSGVHFS